MGFGICVLGYLLTMFDAFAAGIVGWPLLAFGMWKLSSTDKRFRLASAISLLCTAYPVVILVSLLGSYSTQSASYRYIYISYLFLCAVLHAVYLTLIKEMARKNGGENIALSASMWMIFTLVFYACAVFSVFSPNVMSLEFAEGFVRVVAVMKYFIGIANLWFLYTCYAKITTQKQIEKDNAFFAKEKAKEEAKKKKRESEESKNA